MSNANASEKLYDLARGFGKSAFDYENAVRLDDFYGEWGMFYAFNIGPFLSLLPTAAAIFMFYIFKRKNLMGVTQKFILSIMIMDVCFTTTSAVRDGLLRIFHMHYGFVEHSICAEVFISFRLQMLFHSTSLWLNTLMLLHQVLLVGFPLRMQRYDLSVILYSFVLFHIVFCIVFVIVLTFPKFEAIRLVQEFKQGYNAHIIEGCNAFSSAFLSENFSFVFNLFIGQITLLYTKVFPLSVHFISVICLIVLLTKQIRTLSGLIHNVAVSRIKYVVLMKVNIALGISCIFQELPVIVILFYQYGYSGDRAETYNSYFKYFGIATTFMSISFGIGKPIDLLIYASLSKIFKQEIKRMISRGREMCGGCHQNTPRSTTMLPERR